ncbi:MAG TPA: ATP-binding cassette domain-containing protein [Woeseiaceae bacterium]|nr:ATP-binding cassette domain-containing protein [Woeseiaceae bacterium]
MLQFTHLALRRGAKLLLEDVSLQIHPGQKVGITGANGSGKSSLFSLILGEIGPDAGDLAFPRDWVVAHVAQETPSDSRASIEYVLDGDAELRSVEMQIARAEAHAEAYADGQALAQLHGDFEVIDGYTARSRAGQLLHGLGFTTADESRAVDEFSGGWRMRLNLARALMCRSSLLLLDEPTNHLDLDTVIWLEDWLRAYPGTLLLISHDRDFLDSVAGHIVHLENRHAILYAGNYSAFERIRAERLANQQAQYRKQQREIEHIRSFVDRFRAKASKARQAQSRIKALQRMELIAPAHVDSPFHFALRSPAKTPNPLLRIDDASVGYGSTTVLSGVRLSLTPGERIGLLGANGAGKSTLIKLVAGILEPRSGERVPANDLAIGYFAQHQVDQLDPRRSPLEHFFEIEPEAREADLRKYLGGFGFSDDTVFMPTAPFSGGEKSRLALALLVYRRPNLLLLDEPTNHLDLEMRQALSLALQEFAGAMLLVSHDRHLLRVTSDRLFLVHGGSVVEFDGSLDDYPAWLAARNRSEAKSGGSGGEEKTGAAQSLAARKDRKRREAAERQSLKPAYRRLEKAEAALEAAHAEKTALESRLADPTLYEPANKDELRAVLATRTDNTWALAKAEAEWLEATEALERARNELQKRDELIDISTGIN